MGTLVYMYWYMGTLVYMYWYMGILGYGYIGIWGTLVYGYISK